MKIVRLTSIFILLLYSFSLRAGVKESVSTFFDKIKSKQVVLYKNTSKDDGDYFTFQLKGRKVEYPLTAATIMSLRPLERRQLLFLVAKSLNLEDSDSKDKFRDHFEALFLSGKPQFFSEKNRHQVIKPSDFNPSNITSFFFKGLDEALSFGKRGVGCENDKGLKGKVVEGLRSIKKKIKGGIKKWIPRCNVVATKKLKRSLEKSLDLRSSIINIFSINLYAIDFSDSEELKEERNNPKKEIIEMTKEERDKTALIHKSQKCIHDSITWKNSASENLIEGNMKAAIMELEKGEINLIVSRRNLIDVKFENDNEKKMKIEKLAEIDKRIFEIRNFSQKIKNNEEIDIEQIIVMTKEEVQANNAKSASHAAVLKRLDPTYRESLSSVNKEGDEIKSVREVYISKNIKNYLNNKDLLTREDVFKQVRLDLFEAAENNGKVISEEQADQISRYIANENSQIVDLDLIVNNFTDVSEEELDDFEYVNGERVLTKNAPIQRSYFFENSPKSNSSGALFANNGFQEDFLKSKNNSDISDYSFQENNHIFPAYTVDKSLNFKSNDVNGAASLTGSSGHNFHQKSSQLEKGMLSQGVLEGGFSGALGRVTNSDGAITSKKREGVESLHSKQKELDNKTSEIMGKLTNAVKEVSSKSTQEVYSGVNNVGGMALGRVSFAGYSGTGNVASFAAPLADSSYSPSRRYVSSGASSYYEGGKVYTKKVGIKRSESKIDDEKIYATKASKTDLETNHQSEDKQSEFLIRPVRRSIASFNPKLEEVEGAKKVGLLRKVGIGLDDLAESKNKEKYKNGAFLEKDLLSLLESSNPVEGIYVHCRREKECTLQYLDDKGEYFADLKFRFVKNVKREIVGIRMNDYRTASDLFSIYPNPKIVNFYSRMYMKFGDRKRPIYMDKEI